DNGHVPLGTVLHDNATVTGGVTGFPIPATSFTFDSTAVGNAATEAGFTATSDTTAPLAAGNHAFRASVAGDDNYIGDTSALEPVVVDKAQLSVTTTVHKPPHVVVPDNGHVPLGTVLHDNATVTGGVTGFPIPATSFTFDSTAVGNAATEAGFTATSDTTAP